MTEKSTAPQSIYNELNEQQLRVVQSPDGPILVIAGAGSGKTRTLTYRVAHLINSGVAPYRILLLTFTNKAAKEMLGRVEILVPGEVYKIWGGTFHHIANRILRIHFNHTGFGSNYTILDQSDSKSLLNECLKELGYKKTEGFMPQPGVLLNLLSLSRNMLIPLHKTIELRFPYFNNIAGEIEEISRYYQNRKRKVNAMDFDDLLCEWLFLMQNNREIREYYSNRFEYVLVDEYQDTNRLQSEIIDMIASLKRNVMVVGDDSQSIYSFRGADVNNIMDFPERYSDAKIFRLERNYRSSPEILNFANFVIKSNRRGFEKTLEPVRKTVRPPVLVTTEDAYSQASFIANSIEKYIFNHQISMNEIAVLYRAHFHSMELQTELTRRGVPFEVRSGIRFFEQAHVKDIVSYMRLIANPLDETACKRIFQTMPGIGEKTCSKIFKAITLSDNPVETLTLEETGKLFPKSSKPFYQSLRAVFEELAQKGADIIPSDAIKMFYEKAYKDIMFLKYSDAYSRLEDIEHLIEFAFDFASVGDFLSEFALLTSSEVAASEKNYEGESVKLTTIHQAKGLEWAVVFIISLVDGRFPNPKNYTNDEDEEEERRLFYVAATRAKEHLYLTAPLLMKDRSGFTQHLTLSRFVRELPEFCYEEVGGYAQPYDF